ncbi:aldo/keto reductase [Bacillus sp. JJ1474]|uniref:aldo/keto reductase n=1 Tax=Bacillus sp. JJ1474 TaxID=3122955 RepID=UPI002FFF2497
MTSTRPSIYSAINWLLKKKTTLPNLALAWLLAQDGVDGVIPGGKRKERIRENVQASEISFSKEELNIINDILNNN